MKGYYTTTGFFGFIDGIYILFASESDYFDTINETGDTAA